MELKEVKSVDENLLREIVRRIVSTINPVKIILFGSHAYGKPGKGSDLYLFVIVNEVLSSRREEGIKICALLQDLLIPKDIIVATQGEVKEWKNLPQAFLTPIIKKGKVLYERKS